MTTDSTRDKNAPALARPFAVYENYEGGLQIIDGQGRVVLDDVFAYDADKEARNARMDALADALNASTPSAKKPRDHWIDGLHAAAHYLESSTFAAGEMETVRGCIALIRSLRDNKYQGPQEDAAPVSHEQRTEHPAGNRTTAGPGERSPDQPREAGRTPTLNSEQTKAGQRSDGAEGSGERERGQTGEGGPDATHLSSTRTSILTREDAAKIVERKAKALTDEYCHGDTGPGGYTWSNKEAEWQVILLEELAEEFRNGV
jgi:hypothetical protein